MNPQFRDSVQSRAPPPPEQARAIFEKSLEEQKEQILSPWMSEEELDERFGVGLWYGIFRFALWQKEKYRMIDDASKGQNQTFCANERIHTTSAAAAAALTRKFRHEYGKKLRGPRLLEGSSRDMKSAYKQISVDAEHLRFVVIVIYDPFLCVWRYAISYALPFGLAGSVLHFNRVPAFITAVCRRFFAIPVQHFYDDFRILEPALTKGSGFKWFSKIVDLLGWVFDPKKDNPPCHTLEMLGNIEDWSQAGASECFWVRAKAERLVDIKQIVFEARCKKSMPKGLAASLRGKLLNLSFTKPQRTGRGNYHMLNAIADGRLVGWNDTLALELEFIAFDLELEHAKGYPLVDSPKSDTRCWTDASFEPGPDGPKMRMCAIVANNCNRVGIVCDATDVFFRSLVPRSTQIAIGELFAVILAFRLAPEAFSEGVAISFVDNMGVIHAIVNGASTQVDLGALVHGLHRRMALLKASVWWEYVPSPSNIADGGSRIEGIECKLAKEAGISLSLMPCPVLPQFFPMSHPVVWDSWW